MSENRPVYPGAGDLIRVMEREIKGLWARCDLQSDVYNALAKDTNRLTREVERLNKVVEDLAKEAVGFEQEAGA